MLVKYVYWNFYEANCTAGALSKKVKYCMLKIVQKDNKNG